MADLNNTGAEASPPTLAEKTFTAYSSTLSISYQQSRIPYPSKLIEHVLSHHRTTTPSPSDGVLLDVGCGPGTATRSLSPFFHTAYGCDPSAAMIDTARTAPSSTLSNEPVSYHVCTAESLQSLPMAPGTVDLISAAMAAHWFDLPKFYLGAAHLLKPGGTLALWTSSSYFCHPVTTPNAKQVQEILLDLERNILAPYETPGNRLSREMYDKLPLPWDCEPPVLDLPQKDFARQEWNRNGALSEDGTFFRGVERETLDAVAKALGTASMVTRWREANREEVEKGEMEDCVALTVRRLKEAMGGRDWIGGGSGTVVLMFKKGET